MNTTIRHYRAQDLGRALRLWEARGPVSAFRADAEQYTRY